MEKIKIPEEKFSRNGNAFYLLGCFVKYAKEQGMNKDKIEAILDEAKTSDYNHLLVTLMSHIEFSDSIEDEE